MDLHDHLSMNIFPGLPRIDRIAQFLIILFAALVILAFLIVIFFPVINLAQRSPLPDPERDQLLPPDT